MPKALKRWLPVVGTGVLVASVILRLAGLDDLAGPLQAIGEATGITADSAVPLDVLAAAAAGLAGIVMKIWSQWNKALRAAD